MKLSRRVASVKPSATISITMRAKELKAQGMNVISLAAGEPDFDTPEHIKAAAIKALEQGETKYTPSNGLPVLREAIAEKLKAENGLDYSADRIVVGCGAKHSLYNLFQAILDPGDEVVVPAPYWVSYPEFAHLAEGVVKVVPTAQEDGFRIQPAQLEQAINERTRAFVVNSPANPTGMGYNRAALEALAEVLRAHPDVAIVSDEIYEHLTYDGFEHCSFAAVAPDLAQQVFTVNGFSKTYSMTGWRLGYVACPDNASAKAIKCIQDQSTTGTTSFAQYGALAALEGGLACVKEMHAAFDQRRRFLVAALNAIPGVDCLMPEGAFYVFPSVAAWGVPSLELTMRLLDEAYLAPVPGAAFGSEGHMRISFAIGLAQLEEAVTRLQAWHAEHIGG
jgi:aspartate aminotransferase